MNKVSIIIPCYNEEKFISKCLDSIINQDYPDMEILVVDGMSEDKTREIVKQYADKHSFIKLLDNPKKYVPSAMNIGIKHSQADVIARMDAHAVYPKTYISKSLDYLEIFNADTAGGGVETIAEDKITAKSIALVLSHAFGTGGSYFRLGSKEPIWVDTIFGGCYKKEVFRKVGLFNENLKRSQDIEFNLRLKYAGAKILLVPGIPAQYYAKSNLKDFFTHNIEDGIWAIYPLKFIKMPFRLRHYIPFMFISGLLGLALLSFVNLEFFWILLSVLLVYLVFSLYFSIKVAIREKDIRLLFLMPIAFASRHFGYGFGSIFGSIKLLKPWK